MKKFFDGFKQFISKGNVLDMAVGIILGSAFTAIVTALSNGILKPIINWLISLCMGGTNSLSTAFTFLKKVIDPVSGAVDLAASIYIDWGAFISSIINFFLIAFVLYTILKTMMRAKGLLSPKYYGYGRVEYTKMRKDGKTKHEIAEMGKLRDEETAAKIKAEEEEKKKHTTEALLESIKELLTEMNSEKTASKTTSTAAPEAEVTEVKE